MRAVCLTVDDFVDMCRKAESVRGPLPVNVQFRKRGQVVCGLVLDAVPAKGGSTVDFFQLDSDIGVVWCAHHNVRACGGTDGRCTCEADAGADSKARSAAAEAPKASPLGNTGVEA
jgi:hypothetical protein